MVLEVMTFIYISQLKRVKAYHIIIL